MSIGEIIRKYRIEAQITQAELASRMGVSNSAVNKWEREKSMPDIALLVPIARALGITADILLEFNAEISDIEANKIAEEAIEKFKSEPYCDVFEWAKSKIEEYPSSEFLILLLAQILDGQRGMQEIDDAEKYDSAIEWYYNRALGSKNENTKIAAAGALFNFFANKGNFEKAEEFLQYFSRSDPEKKRKQAFIFSKTNRTKEAYIAYEELLLSSYEHTNNVLQSMNILAMEQQDYAKARYFAQKQGALAQLFEMGKYRQYSPMLEIAMAEKNEQEILEITEKLLKYSGDIGAFANARLYADMKFKEIPQDFTKEIKQSLIESFRNETKLDFLKDNPKWREILK